MVCSRAPPPPEVELDSNAYCWPQTETPPACRPRGPTQPRTTATVPTSHRLMSVPSALSMRVYWWWWWVHTCTRRRVACPVDAVQTLRRGMLYRHCIGLVATHATVVLEYVPNRSAPCTGTRGVPVICSVPVTCALRAWFSGLVRQWGARQLVPLCL